MSLFKGLSSFLVFPSYVDNIFRGSKGAGVLMKEGFFGSGAVNIKGQGDRSDFYSIEFLVKSGSLGDQREPRFAVFSKAGRMCRGAGT